MELEVESGVEPWAELGVERDNTSLLDKYETFLYLEREGEVLLNDDI